MDIARSILVKTLAFLLALLASPIAQAASCHDLLREVSEAPDFTSLRVVQLRPAILSSIGAANQLLPNSKLVKTGAIATFLPRFSLKYDITEIKISYDSSRISFAEIDVILREASIYMNGTNYSNWAVVKDFRDNEGSATFTLKTRATHLGQGLEGPMTVWLEKIFRALQFRLFD